DAVRRVSRWLGLEVPPEERMLDRLLRPGSRERRVLSLRQEVRSRAAKIIADWRLAFRLAKGRDKERVRELLKQVDRALAAFEHMHRRPRKPGRPSVAANPRELVAEYRRQLFL